MFLNDNTQKHAIWKKTVHGSLQSYPFLLIALKINPLPDDKF